MSEDTRGPWVDDSRQDFGVSHASHRVKHPRGEAHLDSSEEHTEASIVLHVDHKRLDDSPPCSLHVKTTDKGLMEGLTMVDMTIEEFEDLHERMGAALEAAKDGARYYER